MTQDGKVFCFLNPLSADGTAAARRPELESIFRDLSIDFEFVVHEGDLSQCVEGVLGKRLREMSAIAGVGGDGTHNALVNGLMKFQEENPTAILPPYCIIPFGTGNDIAKSFNISSWEGFLFSELRRGVAATRFGASYQADLGKIGERYFLDAFTTGVDAHILAGRNRETKFLRRNKLLYRLLKGYPIYVLCMLKSFRKCAPIQAKIEVDGKVWYEGDLFNIVINNTRIYAGVFDLTDSAFANDGLLDALIFTGQRDYVRRYFFSHRCLPREMRSFAKSRSESIRHCQGRQFDIELSKPLPAQVDGEEIESGTHFQINTYQNALSLKLPVEPS